METFGPVIATVQLPDAASAMEAARAARTAGADRVEIRVDAFEDLGQLGFVECLAREMPLLVSGNRTTLERREIEPFRRFQAAGAWVDIPFAPDLPTALWGVDRTRLVFSFHDFEGTPGDLGVVLQGIRARRPGVCKVVPTARDFGDLLTVRELLRREGARGDLCAFAMGVPGRASRALALSWGSCATYTSAPGSGPAAPGQMDLRTLMEVYCPREVRGEEPLYGVVGWPLLSTGSPALHNRWLRELGLPGRFVPLPVKDLEAFLSPAWDFGLRGVAVTVPYKRDVLQRVVGCSRLAREVGACNTMLPQGRGWCGANTDVFGIRTALASVPRGVPGLLLGAGGAAAAAAYVLSSRGPLTIAARDDSKARNLAGRFGTRSVAWKDRATVPCDLLVNATSCGQEGEESPFPEDALRARRVFDMVVREGGTSLLRAARERGAIAIPGQAMLEAQARLQFTLFTGRKPPR
jgi:shikimate dehydrogenase